MGNTSQDRPASWLTEEGILYHDLKGYRHLSMDLMRYLSRQHLTITHGKPARVLVLADDLLTVDFEAQLFASHSRSSLLTQAIAIVSHSFVIRHVVSTFVSYHAPVYPVRVFESQCQAENWLRGNDNPAGCSSAD